MSAGGLEQLLAAREVVVLCGSGGVGKTSVAAAAGVAAVARRGGRILVVTIDPARRLANALGLEEFGNVERRVPDDLLRAAGLEPRGELFAAMLDTKASWDDLVLRHAPDEEAAYRILENQLYENLSGRFVQSHDYIAMERLYELHTKGDYDLILVDTPPTRNAIDFLEAPARMADFFRGRLLRWLTMPYRIGGRRGARLLDFASRPFYQMADRILGGQFLRDVAEFFVSFQAMEAGFVERSQAVERLLHDDRTAFVVVTTLEEAPLREAEFFCDALRTRDFTLGGIVANRVLPDALRSDDGLAASQILRDRAEELAGALAASGERELADATATVRVLRTAADTFRDFSVVATREAELRAELARDATLLAAVPALEEDVHDLPGLARIGDALFAARGAR